MSLTRRFLVAGVILLFASASQAAELGRVWTPETQAKIDAEPAFAQRYRLLTVKDTGLSVDKLEEKLKAFNERCRALKWEASIELEKKDDVASGDWNILVKGRGEHRGVESLNGPGRVGVSSQWLFANAKAMDAWMHDDQDFDSFKFGGVVLTGIADEWSQTSTDVLSQARSFRYKATGVGYMLVR